MHDRTDALLAVPITPYTRVEGFHRFAVAVECDQLIIITPAVGMTAAEFTECLKERETEYANLHSLGQHSHSA